MSLTSWITPVRQPVLEEKQVHVWKASLDVSQSQLAVLTDKLSSDELVRANTYRFQGDRGRFVATRGILRTILARYLGAGSGELRFDYSVNGKPELCTDLPRKIRFNVSHCDDRALIAIAQGCDVGVDIERICEDLPVDSIAQMFLAPEEQFELKSVPAQLKCRTFFGCWCRKEAFVKALGCGLLAGLDRFAVSILPGEPPRLRSTRMVRSIAKDGHL